MSEWKTVRIGDFLKRTKVPVKLKPDAEYQLVTVKMHHQGVVPRERKRGKLIGSNMYKVSEGQFILSGIDARNGAFGVVPAELDGAIVTNDFWYFDIDESTVTRDFFLWLTNTPLFLDACIKSSEGTTNRRRLQREKFFNFEFHLPKVSDQKRLLERLDAVSSTCSDVSSELDHQLSLLKQLRQAILQEAVEGKLTADWRNKHPVKKGDPEYDAEALLEKIAAEKEKLVEEGKIKKQKPLPPVRDEEKPFELPEGWAAETLGCISNFIDYRGKTPTKINSGIRLITAKNVRMGYLSLDPEEFISREEYNVRMTRGFPATGDIFFTTEAPMGNVCLNELDETITTGQRIITISLYVNESAFLVLQMMSPYFQNELDQRRSGITAQGIKSARLVMVPVILPPLAEQRAIVRRVRSLFLQMDSLEQQITERKSQSEMLMQAVLREAFEVAE